MPHWLISGAAIVGRVLAGLTGFSCFYLAIFTYEDEANNLQSRLEEFWISVYEKAKSTDFTATATLNRLGRVLSVGSNYLFGSSLLSMKSLLVSFYISLSFSICFYWLFLHLMRFTVRILEYQWVQASALRIINWAILMPAFAGVFYDRLIPFSDHANHPGRTFLVQFTAVAAMIFCVYGLHKGSSSTSLLARMSSISFVGPVLFLLLRASEIGKHDFEGPYLNPKFSIFPLIIAFSFLSDCLSIILMRRLLALISRAMTLSRALLGLLLFLLTGPLFFLLPLLVLIDHVDPYHARQVLTRSYDIWTAEELTSLNAINLFYAISPVCILITLLLHKIFWPLLSRVLYPIQRFAIISNRAVLLSVGVLAFSFAFQLEHNGIKQILNLFSK